MHLVLINYINKMVVYGLYIGYGINIKYDKLESILKKKYDMSDSDSDSDSDSEGQFNYELLERLNLFLGKNPINMSNTGQPLQTVGYPHTAKEYGDHLVALGVFYHITDSDNNKPESELKLKKLLTKKINFDNFKAKFGKTPQFMVIHDDCHCCS